MIKRLMIKLLEFILCACIFVVAATFTNFFWWVLIVGGILILFGC